MKKIKIAYYEQCIVTNCKDFMEIEVPEELDVNDEDALTKYLNEWSEVDENDEALMEIDWVDEFGSDPINYGYKVVRNEDEDKCPEFIQTSY